MCIRVDMPSVLTRLSFLVAALLLGGCATMKPLMFWQGGYEFKSESLEVNELRRALVCETPTEASRIQVFDDALALLASPIAASLQVDQLNNLRAQATYVVIEQGQRRTGGYSLELRPKAAVDEQGLLTLDADWIEPAPDRMQIQILTSLCVLVQLPAKPYNRVELKDGKGNTRAVWSREES